MICAALRIESDARIVSPASCEDSLRLGQEVVDRLHESARLVQARVDSTRQLVHQNRLLIESLTTGLTVDQT
jgi:hypothetical protein